MLRTDYLTLFSTVYEEERAKSRTLKLSMLCARHTPASAAFRTHLYPSCQAGPLRASDTPVIVL